MKLQGRISTTVTSNVQPKVYHEAKELCQEYKSAKEALVKHFKENGYGQWVKKPVEQDSFTVEEQSSWCSTTDSETDIVGFWSSFRDNCPYFCTEHVVGIH